MNSNGTTDGTNGAGPGDELAALRSVLLQIGFDESDFSRHVSLGQDKDMCFCAVRATDGRWDVYYTERGSKSPHARVSTVRGAAYVLLGMIGRGDLITAVRRSAEQGHLG